MTQAAEISKSVVKTDEIIGTNVTNTEGENLGEITEIIIDKLSGKVRYVVLSFGGLFGLGDKLFALPWDILKYDETEDAFLVNIDKEKLKNAPGFDKNNWPNMADRQWDTEINKYYGTRSYLE